MQIACFVECVLTVLLDHFSHFLGRLAVRLTYSGAPGHLERVRLTAMALKLRVTIADRRQNNSVRNVNDHLVATSIVFFARLHGLSDLSSDYSFALFRVLALPFLNNLRPV